MDKPVENHPVFVYGTLLSGCSNHRSYVRPYAHRAAIAKIRGSLYHLPAGYPALLDGDDWVWGELLVFDELVRQEAMNGLDELEDYFGPGDPRNLYERECDPVWLFDAATPLSAFVYKMRGKQADWGKQNGVYLPNGDWRQYMQMGGH